MLVFNLTHHDAHLVDKSASHLECLAHSRHRLIELRIAAESLIKLAVAITIVLVMHHSTCVLSVVTFTEFVRHYVT